MDSLFVFTCGYLNFLKAVKALGKLMATDISLAIQEALKNAMVAFIHGAAHADLLRLGLGRMDVVGDTGRRLGTGYSIYGWHQCARGLYRIDAVMRSVDGYPVPFAPLAIGSSITSIKVYKRLEDTGEIATLEDIISAPVVSVSWKAL